LDRREAGHWPAWGVYACAAHRATNVWGMAKRKAKRGYPPEKAPRIIELEALASQGGERGGRIARRLLGTGMGWGAAVMAFERETGVAVTRDELAAISGIHEPRRHEPSEFRPVRAIPGGPRPEAGTNSVRTVSGGLPGLGRASR
jgi:hypothetical protein